jgi:hypothetical protein
MDREELPFNRAQRNWCDAQLRAVAAHPQVRMFEIKSVGANRFATNPSGVKIH